MAIDTYGQPEQFGSESTDESNMEAHDYGAEDSEGMNEDQPKKHPADQLQEFIKAPNIAAVIDKSQLTKIGMEVVRGYDIDKASRSDWEKQTKTAMDLAMQVTEEKSWPWPKAANVKYPLITTAAIQFSARAYPAIIRGADVVKGEVCGPDPDGKKKERAERIGHHMSYQLLQDMEDWDEDIDKLLLRMAIVGCEFRKTYFDRAMGKNVSELCAAKYVVYNHATPFKKLRRITHELHLYKNDVIERIRGGIFEEIELTLPDGEDNDEDGYFEFLEQHCWYDLDDDGYKEPYIVTVCKESMEVVRIVARFDEDGIYLNDKHEVSKIEPVGYFTKFPFMPNPDGGSYDVGLGILLNPINETINTVLNQLLDAGTLANTGGGFIGNGLRMKGGAVRLSPGEYKQVDNKGGAIRDNIYHMDFKGPSPVLFQLLGMLIEAGKDISSVKDILTGDQNVNQTATTTLALIEQGQKVFSAIYKRVHRSLKDEFKKLYRLNKLYLQPEEYYRFQDKSLPIYLEDYQGDDTDVVPVSDPNLVSDAQQLQQSEALMALKGDPFINQVEIRKMYLTAIKIQNVDEVLVTNPPPPPQDPRADKIKADIAAQHVQVTAEAEKSMAETHLLSVKAADTEASAILKLAQAQATNMNAQMQSYMSEFQLMMQQFQGMIDGQGNVSGMEAPPANQAVSPIPAGLPPANDGGMGGGAIQQPVANAGAELSGDSAGTAPA
ncbi:MAG: portal protein [Burkholderiaceae bacterium]